MTWPTAAIIIAAIYCGASVLKRWIDARYELSAEWLDHMRVMRDPR